MNTTESIAAPPAEERKLSTEYIGYKRIVQPATNGAIKKYVKINYVDGVEASRAPDHEEIIANPLPEIVEIGTMEKPTAIIDTIKKSKKSWFDWGSSKVKYDISGTAVGDKQLFLQSGQDKIASARVKGGKFQFKNVEIKEGAELVILEHNGWLFGGTTKVVSDYVNLLAGFKSYTTDYLSNHKLKPFALKN